MSYGFDTLAALSPPDTMDSLHEWLAGLGATGEWVARLALAALLGGLLGGEREINGHEAGLRTFILVCVGAALAMIVSQAMAEVDWSSSGAARGARAAAIAGGDPVSGNVASVVSVDPGRIAYGVMAGIGFLGAGVIFRDSGRVRGLTTAAGVWSTAALGLTCGLGMYTLSIVVALLLLSTLTILNLLGNFLPTWRSRRLHIRTEWRPDCIDRMERALTRGAGLRVRRVALLSRDDRQEPATALLSVEVSYFNKAKWRKKQQVLLADPTMRIESIV